MIVDDEGPGRVDRELAALLLELPTVDCLCRREPVADTVMIEEILRRARLSMSCEIPGRAKDTRLERQDGVEARIIVLGGPEPAPPAPGWSVESWERFWSGPDPEVAKRRVPTVVHSDVVGHWPGGGGTVRGIDGYLQRVLDFIHLVPDLRLKVEEYAYAADTAFIRWSGKGTGPAGPFECVGVDRFIIRDGLVIENRIISDHEVFRLLARKSNHH